MEIVSAQITRPVEVCWRAFVDHASMTSWVPGLRRAELVAARDDGLPLEVKFEFLGGLSYSLMYSYDPGGHVVRWRPKFGQKGAVSGFARFEPSEAGTQLTYALEHDAGRKAVERAFDDPDVIIEAFRRWCDER